MSRKLTAVVLLVSIYVSCGKSQGDASVRSTDDVAAEGVDVIPVDYGEPALTVTIAAVRLTRLTATPIDIVGLGLDPNPPPAKFSAYRPVVVHTQATIARTGGPFFRMAGSALLARNLGDEEGYELQMQLNAWLADAIDERVSVALKQVDRSQLDRMDVFYMMELALGLRGPDQAGDYLIEATAPTDVIESTESPASSESTRDSGEE